MKEQVLDIALVLKSINGKIDGLSKQLVSAQEEIFVLKKENGVLKDRLAVYKTPKDSHNSSIPPSKDSLAAQAEKSKKLLATRSLRDKSGKSNGGQIGHKGTTLEMASEPDSIIEHKPYFCTHCGNDLSAIQGSVVEIRQVFDVPMPILPIVTEHQLIGKQCSCGHCCQTDFPKEVYPTKFMAHFAKLKPTLNEQYKNTRKNSRAKFTTPTIKTKKHSIYSFLFH